jgi:hypothetical protein
LSKIRNVLTCECLKIDLRNNINFSNWKMGVVIALHKMQIQNVTQQKGSMGGDGSIGEWQKKEIMQITDDEIISIKEGSVVEIQDGQQGTDTDEDEDQLMTDSGNYYTPVIPGVPFHETSEEESLSMPMDEVNLESNIEKCCQGWVQQNISVEYKGKSTGATNSKNQWY